MSLFVCENCSKVENHSSIYKEDVRPGDVEGQWNMRLMHMQGNGNKDLTITKDGKEYVKNAKKENSIVLEVGKNIAIHKESREVWKDKLQQLRNLNQE